MDLNFPENLSSLTLITFPGRRTFAKLTFLGNHSLYHFGGGVILKKKSQATFYHICSSLVAVPAWGQPRESCDFFTVSEVGNLAIACSNFGPTTAHIMG